MATLSSKVTPSGVATAAQGTLADSAVQPNDSPTFGTLTLGTWTITETSGVLEFSSGGSAKFSISAAGVITAADNVIAYGTP